jgi:hypothetical protein
MTAFGAELPMQLQGNYAGSCPLTDLADGTQNGSGGLDVTCGSGN